MTVWFALRVVLVWLIWISLWVLFIGVSVLFFARRVRDCDKPLDRR